ncbi:unnamed protein product [Paramecium primaurelia]|uniref:Uncharacterized protein n=1 Tax=Paramecium primaurelia TaxID=5886 RepID=A0A8S1PKI5_PARPR|nr:unnamed protein product [Paramecium primaurelia]
MDVWRQIGNQKVLDVETVLEAFNNTNSPDQIAYSNCLGFMKLLKSSDLLEQIKNLYSDRYFCQQLSQSQFDNFLRITIKSISLYQGRDEDFVDGINLLQDYFLNFNTNQFCFALLSNKKLLEKHPKIMLNIFSKAIIQEDQILLNKIIQLLGQKQLKSFHHQFLIDLIQIDLTQKQSFRTYAEKLFDSFIGNSEQQLKITNLTFQDIILAFKRLIKWDSLNYKFIAIKLDHYIMNQDKNNDVNVLKLIFYIMTSQQSHLWINCSYLTKTIKLQWKTADYEFRFYRVLKLLRINNHRDVDSSYRMGFNGLSGQKVDSFRLAQDLEQNIKKTIQESDHQIVYLQFIKQAFKREPYCFSYSFIQFLLQYRYEDKPDLYQPFWSLVSKIYSFFFIQLYEQDITNVFDFQGMFVDENGNTKLTTKIGIQKKNARNLVPYFQQLIINSQNLIIMVYKKFYKLFLSEKQIFNFFTNLIYEPLYQQIEFQFPDKSNLKQNQNTQLYYLFSEILDNFQNTKNILQDYLTEIYKQLNSNSKENTFRILSYYQKIHKKYQQSSLSDYCLDLINKSHSFIISEIFQGKNELSQQINITQSQNLKNNLQQLLQLFQPLSDVRCKELKSIQDIILTNFQVNYNISIDTSTSRCFLICLLKVNNKLSQQYYEKQVNNLLQQFENLFLSNGYINQEKVEQQCQKFSDFDEKDQDGQYYQSIIEQKSIAVEQQYIRSIPQLKQQFQILLYLQLLNLLIQRINRYEFEVEGLITSLRRILTHPYVTDDFIIDIWNEIYLIIEQLNEQSSEKWLELTQQKLMNNVLIHLDQTISITTTLILAVILNQKSLQTKQIRIQKLFFLVSELKSNNQKNSLYRIIFNNLDKLDSNLYQKIFFEMKDQLMIQGGTYKLLKLILHEPDNIDHFNLIIKVFLGQEIHQIQIPILQFIAENIFKIGVRYQILIYLGVCGRSLKTKKFAKHLIKQFQLALLQYQDLTQFIIVLNSVVYLVSLLIKDLNYQSTYWLFKKTLKHFFQPRIKQNNKKCSQIINLISYFIEQSVYLTPIKSEYEFSLSDKLEINIKKLPELIQQSNKSITDFTDIISILQQYLNDVISFGKKNVENLKKDQQPQSNLDIFDALLFSMNRNQSKQILKSKSQQLSNPFQNFIDFKQSSKMEKVTKALDIDKEIK